MLESPPLLSSTTNSNFSTIRSPSRQSQQSRRSSSSYMSRRSSKIELLLPGAQQVIEDAAENGRIGLYERLHQKNIYSPQAPQAQTQTQTTPTPTKKRQRTVLLPSPGSPRSPSSPSSPEKNAGTSSVPTAMPFVKMSPTTTTTYYGTLSRTTSTTAGAGARAKGNTVLHMPPIIHHLDRTPSPSPPSKSMRHHRRRRNELQESITYELQQAVNQARKDVSESNTKQIHLIKKYESNLPEAFIIHYPSLRSETHVRAMQKIVDCVWSYYLKAFMRPTWDKWTDLVDTYQYELEKKSCIVIQKILCRGISGRSIARQRCLLLQKKNRLLMKNQLIKIQQRKTAIVIIQKWVRSFVAFRFVDREKRRPKQAVHIISRFWRALGKIYKTIYK